MHPVEMFALSLAWESQEELKAGSLEHDVVMRYQELDWYEE